MTLSKEIEDHIHSLERGGAYGKAKLNRGSELARAIFHSQKLNEAWKERDVDSLLKYGVELVKESVKVLGEAYVYERTHHCKEQDWKEGYVLVGSPRFEIVTGFLGGHWTGGRVDGDDNEAKIIMRIPTFAGRIRQSSLLDLLKKEESLEIADVVRDYQDHSNLAADYVEHNTFKISSKA